MKRFVLALAITALALPLMGTLEPAEARVRWTAGADFSVGGVFFSLGFSDFDRHRHGPRYFYRTQRAFSYRGYQCGSACYIDDGYYYHDRGCPLVGYHFSRYRFDPLPVWGYVGNYGYRSHRGYYGPYAYGYRYDNHRHDHRYDHRYDRRHDRRYDQRNDRRHDRRHDRYDDRHRRYDSDGDSDSDRRGRYDRNDRDRRGDDRGAERSRSRRRDRD